MVSVSWVPSKLWWQWEQNLSAVVWTRLWSGDNNCNEPQGYTIPNQLFLVITQTFQLLAPVICEQERYLFKYLTSMLLMLDPPSWDSKVSLTLTRRRPVLNNNIRVKSTKPPFPGTCLVQKLLCLYSEWFSQKFLGFCPSTLSHHQNQGSLI